MYPLPALPYEIPENPFKEGDVVEVLPSKYYQENELILKGRWTVLEVRVKECTLIRGTEIYEGASPDLYIIHTRLQLVWRQSAGA